MSPDQPEVQATEIVELLEAGDADGVRVHLTPELQASTWSVAGYLSSTWEPGLDELAGSPRQITGATPLATGDGGRVTIAGPNGQALVTVRFDDAGCLSGLALNRTAEDGIGNIVIGCPRGEWRNDRVEGEPRELAAFYADLLGMRIIRDDWIKIGVDRFSAPQLAFGGDGWTEGRAPRWPPDPDYPQQVHLDFRVGDLDAADQLVRGGGAKPLQDKGDFRTYADPFGHPFCLYADPTLATGGAPAVIHRIVFDCADPQPLAEFYDGLLGKDVEPAFGFQSVAGYQAPRWPDANHPAQIHLDLRFDDGPAAADRAERLGATRLPAMGGSCPVHADPAGHPFCLCMHGQ